MELNSETILEKDVLKGVGPTTIKKLKDAGLVTLKQIAVLFPAEIVARTGMGIDTAAKVSSLAQKALSVYRTADELYEERKSTIRRLKTGVPEFDDLLGGGFESGVVTELAGEYAGGKTQICFNQTVMVQLPEEQGGFNAKAIVIDTENTFRPDRIAEMAEARELDVLETLQNIYITDAYNSQHLEILIRGLAEKLQEGNFGLVIVDSLIGHFRSEYIGREMLAQRQQKLGAVLGNLLRIAESFNLVVLVTNQAQANPTRWGNPNRPAGGHIMGHGPAHRIWLRKGKRNNRIAQIIDSSYLPEGEALFHITEKGIEGKEE